MLPIRSEQYLLHTDKERADLMRQRQERVNVLLDLGCAQETINQADARVLEIDEADTLAAASARLAIHDEVICEFSDDADAKFAADQLIKRMMSAPWPLPTISTEPVMLKQWFEPTATLDRALRAWGEPGVMAEQIDYYKQSLEAMRRLPK